MSRYLFPVSTDGHYGCDRGVQDPEWVEGEPDREQGLHRRVPRPDRARGPQLRLPPGLPVVRAQVGAECCAALALCWSCQRTFANLHST